MARRRTRTGLAHEPSTLIAFESPNRLQATLGHCRDIFGPDRMVTVARELTKRFETIRTGLAAKSQNNSLPKRSRARSSILIAPAPEGDTEWTPEKTDALLRDMLRSMPSRKRPARPPR
jgi:16S rRNA (cytidine1402-2'-O)-methyltransferase